MAVIRAEKSIKKSSHNMWEPKGVVGQDDEGIGNKGARQWQCQLSFQPEQRRILIAGLWLLNPVTLKSEDLIMMKHGLTLWQRSY